MTTENPRKRVTRAQVTKVIEEEAPPSLEETEAAQEHEFKIFAPRDVISYEGPLYVKNVSSTFVSFDDGKGNILKLGKQRTSDTTDKYDSEDSIKALPSAIARHPGFQKFWRKGHVVVTDDPDIELELDEFAESDAENDRLQQAFVNGLISRPQKMNISLPFEVQGIDKRYPNPNSDTAVRTF